MLLTLSSQQTELEAIMPHRDSMRGHSERLTRRAVAFTFLVGGFGFLWGLSPRGLWLCHTAISHSDAGIQGERERVVTEAKQQRKTASERGEPHFSLIHSYETKSVCFICLFRPVDWLRERTWADARSLAGYLHLRCCFTGLTEAYWLLTQIKGATGCLLELQLNASLWHLLQLHRVIYIYRQTQVLHLLLGGKCRIIVGKQQH